MRIRPPELETSICDAKYHVHWEHCDVLSMQMDSDLVIYRTTLVRTFQLVTICRVDKSEVLVVLISPHYSKCRSRCFVVEDSPLAFMRKWVYLVTLAMSLFDLQDVCIVIGSLATLDLPMVVDLIGIYVLKRPYCTLTTTNWFLQALSVIPRGSWGDVARRFTMIRWASPKLGFRSHNGCGPTASCIPEPLRVTQPPPLSSKTPRRRRPPTSRRAVPPSRRRSDRTCSDHLFEEILFVPNSSGLLVQADEGILIPVVYLIKEFLPPPTLKSQIPCEFGWSQAPRRQQGDIL
ncbi:hypothetical protein F511_23744 [Dorcoceras hygrometricum]|uniref:Uncharacterized protein n=1 Tax=Dorcoceras hygrometricum TaxID=472368 RepID=A0A2Z7CUA8_9LAMI|nr:hypothetical protein F511_23744 [Dorcoceras hygrometricum]